MTKKEEIMYWNHPKIGQKLIEKILRLEHVAAIIGNQMLSWDEYSEDLLADSEERYRRIFETASDGIVLLEKGQGHILKANLATETMLGYTMDVIKAKEIMETGFDFINKPFQSKDLLIKVREILER